MVIKFSDIFLNLHFSTFFLFKSAFHLCFQNILQIIYTLDYFSVNNPKLGRFIFSLRSMN